MKRARERMKEDQRGWIGEKLKGENERRPKGERTREIIKGE